MNVETMMQMLMKEVKPETCLRWIYYCVAMNIKIDYEMLIGLLCIWAADEWLYEYYEVSTIVLY